MLRRSSALLTRTTLHQRRLCSVDDLLKATLSRVALRVKQQNPNAVIQETPAEIPGVRSAGPKMVLRFTCTHGPCVEQSTEDQRTTTRLISKRSYETGAFFMTRRVL